ncbi:hypothetical protein NPS01_07120 [Nocardioides psychrotolerans]|uniref:Fibronectin type-III domain-containing protein n=1 Tax=Nocardioides psychrotolerans TaxID=1005945 RepID=A0A1I3D676_9ACTN|nr:hypothetical protein [Nocardioides psychrotolerans]GEP37049.1 hypothetical protein NPS01_07120 [Nocardioides psychrotolerans]SFH82031.1 hypothetical protein SAMN05216561_102363 [Nocardioides psychrotolerans]
MMNISGSIRRRTALLMSAVMLPLLVVAGAPPAQAAVAKPGGLKAVNASTSSLVLTWKPVARATSYDVEIATDPSFDDLVDDNDTENTQFTPDEVLPVAKLFWRVRASTSAGDSKWATSSFTPARRSGPALIGPVSGTTLEQPGSPPVLTWAPVPGAEHYEVEIDGVEHDWVDTQTLETDTTSLVVAEPQPNGVYWWRVRAVLDNEVNTRDSTERSYRIGALDHVTLTETSAEMEEVVLSWDPIPGAVAYEIRVSTDNDFNVITDARTLSGTAYSPPNTYDNASYWWQVRAKNALGQSEEWPIYPERTGEFRRYWDAVPELIYPAEGATVSDDTYLQWTPTRLASTYRLYVGTDPGFSTNFVSCDTTQTTLTLGAARIPEDDACLPKASGRYFWRVRAMDGPESVNSVFSSVSSFTYQAPAPPSGTLGLVTGQRLMLDGNGSNPCDASLQSSPPRLCENMMNTPVFDWNPAIGATSYRLYLAHDRLFTNMVKGFGDAGSVVSLPTTTNTRLALTQSLPETQAGEAYYWFIRSCDAKGLCGPTPEEATNAFQKKSAPIQLVTPTAGALLQDQVTFDWTDFLETNQAATDPSTGEHPGQAARSYHLQVSDRQTFGSTEVIDNVTVDQTTYTAFTRAYPEGQLWWRVQAIDGAGNGLTWSDPRPFTKVSPAPRALTPSNGQAVSGVQPFRWEALDYAKYYDLEVYRNNDRLASSANRALYAYNIRQTAFASTKTLQSLGQDFVWRIRRSDFSGNKSAWGPWNSFRVTATLPTLVAPGSGKTVPRSRSLFTWRPSPRATYYYWQLRRGNDLEDSVRTSATSWAPTNALDKGAYTWRVVSMDSNGDVLRASAWRKLKAS